MILKTVPSSTTPNIGPKLHTAKSEAYCAFDESTTILRLILSLNLAIPLSHNALGRDDGDGENAPPIQQKSVWATGFASGLEQSQATQKPLLVVFGAEWCSWCRKLERELTSEAASSVRDEWTLAKVDVDEDEELASKYDVQALPTIVVVDTTGAKIESVEGYMPIDQLAGWLADQKAGAVSVLDAAFRNQPTQATRILLSGLLFSEIENRRFANWPNRSFCNIDRKHGPLSCPFWKRAPRSTALCDGNS